MFKNLAEVAAAAGGSLAHASKVNIYMTDLTQFPTLVGISTHLEALPPFAAARPEVQPDAQ